VKRVAVVAGDDASWQVAPLFKGANYELRTYPSGGTFLDAVSTERPDIVVLDLKLPTMSGWDIVTMLRGNPETRRMLIIVCADSDRSPEDVARAFDVGVDEYFTAPMDRDVFLARLAALLRRSSWPHDAASEPFEQIRMGPLVVDITEHVVRLSGKPVQVTALEFDLLVYFLRKRDCVVTRDILLESVWKTDPNQETRTVDKRVSQLRRKLGDFGKRIQTVSGVGYCLRTA